MYKPVTEQLYFDKISWSNSFNCFLPGRFSVLSFHTALHRGTCFLKDKQFQKNMTPHVKVGGFFSHLRRCHSYLPIRVWGGVGGAIMFSWKNMKICICNTVNKIKINTRFWILFTGSVWVNCAIAQPCMWVMLMYEFIQYSLIILPSNVLENSYQNFPEQPVI